MMPDPNYTPVEQITTLDALEAAFEQVNAAMDAAIAERANIADSMESVAANMRAEIEANETLCGETEHG